MLSIHGQGFTPPHYKSRRVKDYLEENKDTLVPVYLPTASPEFMMVEDRGDLEYSQKRVACPKILLIL